MSQFVGGYVDDIKAVSLAAILSHQNAIILGAPGWGKTAVSRSILGQMGTHYSFVRVDPSTPPDVVKGAYNPLALLEGRLERIVTGTPYDPCVQAAIIDEIGRGNDVLFDALLDVLDRQDTDGVPVLATSNFMPSKDRTQALIDRFGLWLWLRPDTLDVQAVVSAQLNGNGKPQVSTHDLPTWTQVEEIRQAVPGAAAIRCIQTLIGELVTEATTNGRQVNPRRLSQWSALLFRTGVWFTGQADFASLPDASTKLLRYAWPSPDPAEATAWAQIASVVVDTIGAAIDGALAEMVNTLKRNMTNGKLNPNGMTNVATALQGQQATLDAIAKNDPRITEAKNRMNELLARAIRGEALD